MKQQDEQAIALIAYGLISAIVFLIAFKIIAALLEV